MHKDLKRKRFLIIEINTYFMIFTIQESELLISVPVPLKKILNTLIYNFEGLVNELMGFCKHAFDF